MRALSADTLTTCWRECGVPTDMMIPLLDDVWAAATWEEATQAARLGLAQARMPADAYSSARARKFDTFAELVRPYVNGDLVDVGAGGPDLLERLPAQTRLTTDIMEADRAVDGIRHVVQPAPDALPFADASCDTILMTGMAHHLQPDIRDRLLAEVHRCLRPGGTLVLIEETFSEQSGCGPASTASMRALSAGFDALSRADRLDFLAFTDWWGNRVMKGSDAIPLPMAFLDLGQWTELLAAARLPVTHVEQLGVMSGGGHLATPRALIVGTRA